MTPLVFGVLKGLTPSGVETAFHDERLEPIPTDAPADLVAMTVETYTARHAYELADEFRRHGTRVVLGGYHATFCPGEAEAHADAVVVGDAEPVWARVLVDAGAGRLQRRYEGAEFGPLDGMRVDRSVYAGKRYPPIHLVQYGRGCRYACDFCSIHAFYGSSLRQRPPAEVAAEIEVLPRLLGVKHVVLVDDNLFVDVPRAEALFDALTPLRITWSCQVSIDVAADERLLDRMARSGCRSALVGFESLNAASLRQIRKAWNLRHGGYAEVLRRFRDRGIMVYGTFVFGCDEDTPDSFDRTLEFALSSKMFLANFNPLTPTPGAALYDRLAGEGRLLHDRWWLDPAYRYGMATFRPRGMTPAQLEEGCFRARREFNRLGSIASRALDPRANARDPLNLAIYLASNWTSRREILNKQGARLGGAPAPAASQPAVA